MARERGINTTLIIPGKTMVPPFKTFRLNMRVGWVQFAVILLCCAVKYWRCLKWLLSLTIFGGFVPEDQPLFFRQCFSSYKESSYLLSGIVKTILSKNTCCDFKLFHHLYLMHLFLFPKESVFAKSFQRSG